MIWMGFRRSDALPMKGSQQISFTTRFLHPSEAEAAPRKGDT